MNPTPQPKPKLDAVDDQPITLIEVVNPSLLLMDTHKRLQILLSRNTLIEPRAIHLRGVRLVEIPLGWRLALIRFASRYCKVRLPDELEFGALDIDTGRIPSPALAGNIAVGQVKDPTLLVELTAAEYMLLCNTNGRTLLRWVIDKFNLVNRAGIGLPVKRRRAA